MSLSARQRRRGPFGTAGRGTHSPRSRRLRIEGLERRDMLSAGELRLACRRLALLRQRPQFPVDRHGRSGDRPEQRHQRLRLAHQRPTAAEELQRDDCQSARYGGHDRGAGGGSVFALNQGALDLISANGSQQLLDSGVQMIAGSNGNAVFELLRRRRPVLDEVRQDFHRACGPASRRLPAPEEMPSSSSIPTALSIGCSPTRPSTTSANTSRRLSARAATPSSSCKPMDRSTSSRPPAR